LFLGQTPDDDPDNDGNPSPKSGVDPNTLARFTDVENDLERWANDADRDGSFNLVAQTNVMKFIHDTVPEFRNVSISQRLTTTAFSMLSYRSVRRFFSPSVSSSSRPRLANSPR